jgi:hypothetical protein
MKIAKSLGIFLAGFFIIGCATDRSANRGPEEVIVQVESSENYGALVKRLNA